MFINVKFFTKEFLSSYYFKPKIGNPLSINFVKLFIYCQNTTLIENFYETNVIHYLYHLSKQIVSEVNRDEEHDGTDLKIFDVKGLR